MSVLHLEESPVLLDYAVNADVRPRVFEMPSSLLGGFDAFHEWLITGGYSPDNGSDDEVNDLHPSFQALVFATIFDIDELKALSAQHVEAMVTSVHARQANSTMKFTPRLVLQVLRHVREVEIRWLADNIMVEAAKEVEELLASILMKAWNMAGQVDKSLAWGAVWAEHPEMKEIVIGA